MINYYKARAYLYKLDPNKYKDLLHESFLTYFDRTGRNLFEENNRKVITVVRNQYYDSLRERMYKINGVRYAYEFLEYEESVTITTPLDYLIRQETYDRMVASLKKFTNPPLATAIFNLKIQGYSASEISKEVNLNQVNVRRYIKNFGKQRPKVY